jgi:hypothetical protein
MLLKYSSMPAQLRHTVYTFSPPNPAMWITGYKKMPTLASLLIAVSVLLQILAYYMKI